MTEEEVTVRTRVKGAREAAGDLKKVSAATDQVGDKAEVAGAKAQASGRRLSLFGRNASGTRGRIGSLTKTLIGFTGAFAAIQGLRASVDTTEDLGKAAMGLSRNLGLSDKEAVRWAGTARLRGIDAAALGKSGAILGKQMLQAARGSKTASAAFRALGVSQATLRKGNFTDVLTELADGYSKMPAGVKRTALAQQLLGRGSASLTPLLASGSKGLKEQLGLMDKYGVTALAAGQGGIKKFLAAQRESKAATLGFQVAIGTTLIPILTKLLGVLPWLSEHLRKGDGAFGMIKSTIEDVSAVISTLTGFFSRNQVAAKILTGVLIGLGAAFAIAKVIQAAQRAMVLFNATLLANPIVAVIAALVLLGLGLVAAYRHFEGFRRVVDAVFSWIRDHWPLLLVIITGPLGLAITTIVRHWRPLVGFFKSIWSGVRGAFEAAWAVIEPILDKITSAIDTITSFFGSGNSARANAQANAFRDFGGAGGGIPTPGHNAAGGLIRRGGISWVGERGPELVALPTGAAVYPHAMVGSRSDPLPAARGVTREVIRDVILECDGRELARIVDSRVADRRARRYGAG